MDAVVVTADAALCFRGLLRAVPWAGGPSCRLPSWSTWRLAR